MTTFSKIVLLSKSSIKFAALEKFLANLTDAMRSMYFSDKLTIETVEPGETGCPQPISLQSATTCIQRRLVPHLSSMKQADDSVLFIAIENYLEHSVSKDQFWDRVLVMFYSKGGNWCLKSKVHDSPAVRAPDAYVPSLNAKVGSVNGIKGCTITLGEMMHADNPSCPTDDWLLFSPYALARLNRKQQILETLNNHFANLRKNVGLAAKRAIYIDTPKPGVKFADVFPLICDFGPELVAMMTSTIQNCNTGGKNLCCVGLECRGLLLASNLSAAHKQWPLLPLRKKDKLPRDELHPIESITYKTEYSSDTLEAQPRYVTDSIKMSECILIDDVLATGGSLCAAADLVARLGLKVAMVLVLFDIPPLRSTWVNAFAKNPNLAGVPVCFVF